MKMHAFILDTYMRQWHLYVYAINWGIYVSLLIKGLTEWIVPFRVTKPVAGLSVNKHKQTTRPELGAQWSTKLSTFRKA